MSKRLSAQAVVMLSAAPASDDGQPRQPTFTVNAYNGDAIRPYSPYLDAPLVIDLAGIQVPSEKLSVLLNHDSRAIVGQTTSVSVSASSIDMEGILTGNINDMQDPAAKVAGHARNGFEWKASIDGEIQSMEFVKAGVSVSVNGKQFTGPVYVARATILDGFSFVSTGADRSATARVAARSGDRHMDFNEWLTAKKFDPAALEDDQRDLLLKAFEAEKSPAPKTEPSKVKASSLDDVLRPIKEKQVREQKILACVKQFAERVPDSVLPVIEATGRVAIAEGWDTEKLELRLWQECGPLSDPTPRPSSRDHNLDSKVFEAGLCRAGGLPNIERHFDERTLEMADRKWRSGFGLGQLLVHAARVNSNEECSYRDVDPLLRAAFAPGRRGLQAGGPSTFDVSGILSNVANKFIVSHFNAVDGKWSSIARRRPVSDFKQVTVYSLTGDFTYREVGAGGDLDHGTIGETTYTNQARTYGRTFAIDRRDIINDDLNAFQQVLQRLGRGGALKLNDVFWATFLNNSTFFHSDYSNVYTNSAAALSLPALEYAEQLFINQTDPDGKPMAVMPSILLVPPAIKRTAMRLMNSTELREHTGTTTGGLATDTPYGTANTFQGDYAVVSTPYMSSAALSGSSSSTWYLLANPADLPTIEVCFLNGVERPTVDSAQADFDTLGIKMRGFFDFGVSLQEPRGGVKMAIA